jgi:hypothetical protein
MSVTEGSGARESGLQRVGSESRLWLEREKASWVGNMRGLW